MGGKIDKKRLILWVLLAGGLLLVLTASQWAEQQSIVIVRDTDDNGLQETYTLNTDNRVTVHEGKTVLWESPPEWKIKRIIVADADNNGRHELLMVLWKHGSFGAARPRWENTQDQEYSNHLFVYRLETGKMKPVWCSSALERPIIELEVHDVNGDGKNQLDVLEGPPAGAFHFIGRFFIKNNSIWQWQGWGFVKCDD